MTDIKHKPDGMTPEPVKPHPLKYDTPQSQSGSNNESAQRERTTNRDFIPSRDDVIPSQKGGLW